MAKEDRESELARLHHELDKALEDEVFGGLSTPERAEYNWKVVRINELEIALTAEKKLQSSEADQRRNWDQPSQTDIPQEEARQPYGSREKDSANAFPDSTRIRGKKKSNLRIKTATRRT